MLLVVRNMRVEASNRVERMDVTVDSLPLRQ